MIRLNCSREVVVQMCSYFDDAARVGVQPTSDAKVVLHTKQPIGLKYQKVVLAPGLYGTITSDDGKAITVSYHAAKIWLKQH